MFLKTVESQYYIDVDQPLGFTRFSDALFELLCKNISCGYKSLVFVCIGTDRSTGDSLGPLVGYKIGEMRHSCIHIYGNLESPVHAKNISEIMEQIYDRHEHPLVVAIDACLGKVDHVGYVNIGEGSIKPGSGVKKDLPPVGDIFITGIVNIGGFMDFIILQNTRLSIVMKMADMISMGIRHAVWKISNDPALSALLGEH